MLPFLYILTYIPPLYNMGLNTYIVKVANGIIWLLLFVGFVALIAHKYNELKKIQRNSESNKERE